MKFVFKKKLEVVLAQQALRLLAAEEALEKVEFAKILRKQGWQEFKVASVADDYGNFFKGYWWLVDPSEVSLKWQDRDYCPVRDGVDTVLYYDLSQ